MQSGPTRWPARVVRRLRRFERREARAFLRWIEDTRNLLQLSALLFVTLLMVALTYLSNQLSDLSFLLYPPLAAGAYTLFRNPRGQYADPWQFVGGLTAGAACGWLSLLAVRAVGLAGEAGTVPTAAAALTILMTGGVTWALSIEEPAAFATALLTLVVQGQIEDPALYVLSIAVGSGLVAAVFVVWRRSFYQQRADILYESTKGDDHVLVPLRGPTDDATVALSGHLAAAHDAGKVVLLDMVNEAWVADAQRQLLDGEEPDVAEESAPPPAGAGETHGATAVVESPPDAAADPESAIDDAIDRIERLADHIESDIGVPCEAIVAVEGASPAETVRQAAREANCDLIAVPYETADGAVTPFITRLFDAEVDVLVHRSYDGRTEWRQVMVPVRRASDVAHSMIDFGLRLTRPLGQVSVAHCVSSEAKRREADDMLANLVETFEGNVETRVSRASIEDFLARVAPEMDMVIIGASRDRSAASRLLSPPTFERVDDLETDVAILDRS